MLSSGDGLRASVKLMQPGSTRMPNTAARRMARKVPLSGPRAQETDVDARA